MTLRDMKQGTVNKKEKRKGFKGYDLFLGHDNLQSGTTDVSEGPAAAIDAEYELLLMTEITGSRKRPVNVYQTTRRHIIVTTFGTPSLPERKLIFAKLRNQPLKTEVNLNSTNNCNSIPTENKLRLHYYGESVNVVEGNTFFFYKICTKRTRTYRE